MKNKKVALINPGRNDKYAMTEPLSLGFLAGYLRKNGIEVAIIDGLAGQNIKKEIEKFKPDIAGITATTPMVEYAYQVAKMCREKGILTVIGGVHASILPEEALRHADVVVKGEGEIALLDIVKNNIRSGIVSRSYIKNIDDVPIPARDLMQMDFYLRAKDRLPDAYIFRFIPPHTKSASILTSRGCPYNCTFCHNSWKDIPWRFNSAERVVEEIEHLIKNYDIKALFFIEDNFFANKQRVRRVCQLIKEKNISIMWAANARVDNIDIDILKTAKEAGCKEVIFGFESGSQRILNVLNKKTTVEQNYQAVKLCCQAGLLAAGTVMIGNPTETVEDIRMTQDFVRDCGTDCLAVSITTPFPGTELWKYCKENNLIPDSFKWENADFSHVAIPVCQNIPPEEIEKFYRETLDIAHEKMPFSLRGYIMDNIKSPEKIFARIVRIVKNPQRVLKYLKKIKF